MLARYIFYRLIGASCQTGSLCDPPADGVRDVVLKQSWDFAAEMRAEVLK